MLELEHEHIISMYDTSDLNDLYRQISVSENTDFDQFEEIKLVESYIEKCFDSNFLKIESKILISDVNQLNLNLAKLIKYCIKGDIENPDENHISFKKIHIIFICYCDYFDLSYNDCYCKLHGKLKDLIVQGYITLIGKDNYKKIETRLVGIKPLTLFDLVKK